MATIVVAHVLERRAHHRARPSGLLTKRVQATHRGGNVESPEQRSPQGADETTNAEPDDAETGHRHTGSGGDDRYRRPGLGILAGLVVLLIVAVPAGILVWFALLAFSGCFIECSQPQPAVGALWGGLAIFLLALPVAAGLLVARVPLARGWPWLVGAATLILVGALYAQRIV
jgi:hypothetical protein